MVLSMKCEISAALIATNTAHSIQIYVVNLANWRSFSLFLRNQWLSTKFRLNQPYKSKKTSIQSQKSNSSLFTVVNSHPIFYTLFITVKVCVLKLVETVGETNSQQIIIVATANGFFVAQIMGRKLVRNK